MLLAVPRGAAFLAARLLAVASAGPTHDRVADDAVLPALRPGVARERPPELRRTSRLADGERRRLTRRHFADRPRQLRADQRPPVQRLVLRPVGSFDVPGMIRRRGGQRRGPCRRRGGGCRRARRRRQTWRFTGRRRDARGGRGRGPRRRCSRCSGSGRLARRRCGSRRRGGSSARRGNGCGRDNGRRASASALGGADLATGAAAAAAAASRGALPLGAAAAAGAGAAAAAAAAAAALALVVFDRRLTVAVRADAEGDVGGDVEAPAAMARTGGSATGGSTTRSATMTGADGGFSVIPSSTC
jgi:hypothetical protein